MPKNDIRFSGQDVQMQHHSARGHVQRNANNFTRGSQLFMHEIQMFLAGVKVPLLITLAIFFLLYLAALSLWYSHEQFNLVVMKLWSGLWGMMKFDPDKTVDLQLLDGKIVYTKMLFVERFPDVISAWNRIVNITFGCAIVSVGISLPANYWFVAYSKKRGHDILLDHHERGALLVDRELLHDNLRAFNSREAEKEFVSKSPDSKPADVHNLGHKMRRKLEIHRPYVLAGHPYPWRTEMSHTMIIGSTGTGKTVQLLNMIAQMKARGDRAIVFDLTGQFVERFYDPETDIILNPLDNRCPSWSIFNDCDGYVDFVAAAPALVPSDGGGSEPFWIHAARTLFVEMAMRLQDRGETTNKAIAQKLMTADLKQVSKMMKNTLAAPLTATEAARMAESIRSTFNTNAQALRFLPDHGEKFSINEWLREGKEGSILFISSSYNDLELTRTLLTLWMNIAVHGLLELPRTRNLRTWFFFDEVHALHRLPAIEDGLQTARGFGGAFVLGLHSFDKLCETYGEEAANTLAALARTKLILGTADYRTAEVCSEFIGNREVRRMDEAYSYGISQMRDGSTVTPTKGVEPLVMPDDLMGLPSLTGYLKFAEGFPAARISYEYRDWPIIQPGFDRRQNIRPVEFYVHENIETTISKPGLKPQNGTGDSGGPENKIFTPDEQIFANLFAEHLQQLPGNPENSGLEENAKTAQQQQMEEQRIDEPARRAPQIDPDDRLLAAIQETADRAILNDPVNREFQHGNGPEQDDVAREIAEQSLDDGMGH